MNFIAHYRYKGASVHVPPVRRIFKAPSLQAAQAHAERVARKQRWKVEKVAKHTAPPKRSWSDAK